VNKSNQNRGVVNPPESAINPNNTKQYVLNRKTFYLYEAEWHSKGHRFQIRVINYTMKCITIKLNQLIFAFLSDNQGYKKVRILRGAQGLFENLY
jgi:hypothetical protein